MNRSAPWKLAQSTKVAVLVLTLCVVVGGVCVAAAQKPAHEQEHLPLRSKPPRPGERPSGLPAYSERLGVPARSETDRQFDRIVDEFLLFHFRVEPVRATKVGLHDYDALLPPSDRDSIQASIAERDSFLIRLDALDVERLERERRFDHAMLASRLRGTLLNLRTIQSWKRDPNYYLWIAWGGIHSLLERDYAPLEDRGWNVVARLQAIPYFLRDARKNLDNPPRAYTELAIGQAADLVRFLSNELPVQMAPVQDPVLREEYDHHLAAAAGSAADFYDWLRFDLLPRSSGELSLGPDTYARKLLYDEMIASPLDSLFHRGETALHETQRQMEKEAMAIGAGLSVREALEPLALEAPTAGDLLRRTEAELGSIRRFVAAHPILTSPGHEDLEVAETPVFQRSRSLASMDSPGVLETGSSKAYYYVTPPDDRWPPKRQAEHLRFYNRFELGVVSIHEVLPGRYYQSLAFRNCPSLIRALFGTRSNSEGWADYCEQMMLEEGYGAGDPRYRLAQLNAALRHLCHCLVGISLHARGGKYEEAVSFFEREGYMDRMTAEGEVRRGLGDPACAVSTLGKWEISALRADAQKARGAGFRLSEFHDRFLTYGGAPVALIRKDWREAE